MRFTVGVKERRGLKSMQHGLWLGIKLVNSPSIDSLVRAVRLAGLRVVTLNTFPYENFHAEKVKRKVYRPHWGESTRLTYTLRAAEWLAGLLPEGESKGTLSTLPMGYSSEWNEESQAVAEQNLCAAVLALEALESRTGKHIRLCLEMEPGCVLEETSQILDLFECRLPMAMRMAGGDETMLRRYLGVCFDVCHQAIMYEDVSASLLALHSVGIEIGKIQVSSALTVASPARPEVHRWLQDYAESRYLHQTTALDSRGQRLFSDDLALALNDRHFLDAEEWRVHFHIPVHYSRLDMEWVGTTSDSIGKVFSFLAAHPDCTPQIELETYTWTVLPDSRRPISDNDLINGLGAELRYVESLLQRYGLLEEAMHV